MTPLEDMAVASRRVAETTGGRLRRTGDRLLVTCPKGCCHLGSCRWTGSLQDDVTRLLHAATWRRGSWT